MSRFPDTSKNANSEVLTIRISPNLKDKLNSLAKKKKFGCTSSSELVRYLIEYHSR